MFFCYSDSSSCFTRPPADSTEFHCLCTCMTLVGERGTCRTEVRRPRPCCRAKRPTVPAGTGQREDLHRFRLGSDRQRADNDTRRPDKGTRATRMAYARVEPKKYLCQVVGTAETRFN